MEKSASALRHSARGCFNAIKLCVSALDLPCTCQEQIEFLDDVISSTDKMCILVDDLAVAVDHTPPAPLPRPA